MEEKETFIYQLPSLLVEKPSPSGVIPLNFWVNHLWTKSKLLENTRTGNKMYAGVMLPGCSSMKDVDSYRGWLLHSG